MTIFETASLVTIVIFGVLDVMLRMIEITK